MMQRTVTNVRIFALATALTGAIAAPALAGPPLVCFPFDIGTAKSLAWTSGPELKGMKADYDRSRLTEDTLALLTPTTPILVRMETLRRATLYATTDKRVAETLLSALLERARKAGSDGNADALSLFDAGYLAESYKQANALSGWTGALASTVDGRVMVERSLAMRKGDPAIAFAAALITGGRSGHDEHVRRARNGAAVDVLLARNIAQLGR
jgi:hypothetical protein